MITSFTWFLFMIIADATLFFIVAMYYISLGANAFFEALDKTREEENQ